MRVNEMNEWKAEWVSSIDFNVMSASEAIFMAKSELQKYKKRETENKEEEEQSAKLLTVNYS